MDKPKVAALISLLALLASFTAQGDEILSPRVEALVSKAQAGDIDAQFSVGSAYDWGHGAPRDGTEAMKWYRMAAEQGHVEAQNSVGSILQAEGRHAEALLWYRRASEQNHAAATNSLAYLYDLGLGVKQDRQKGFELYSRAADLGWAESMWNLAIMHAEGQVGNKDMFAACLWTLRARSNAEMGSRVYNYTTEAFQHLQEKLGEERFDECREEAGAWVPPAKQTATGQHTAK